MSHLQRFLPSPLALLLKAVYYRLFRLSLRVECAFQDAFRRHRAPGGLELPPALLRYRVSESLSVDNFLNVGKRCAEDIAGTLEEFRFDSSRRASILDFGCGCGRTVRWLMERWPNFDLTGADVDGEAIRWCQTHLAPARFVCTGKCPPLPFANGSFDAIYCVSVFTHLDEEMQDLWIRELHRLLKPNGVLILTVHGRAAATLLDVDQTGELERTGILHIQSSKLSGILPDWYNTTWHSEPYIKCRLSLTFPKVRYKTVPGATQDIVVAKR